MKCVIIKEIFVLSVEYKYFIFYGLKINEKEKENDLKIN